MCVLGGVLLNLPLLLALDVLKKRYIKDVNEYER
jgi:hypothetical protein